MPRLQRAKTCIQAIEKGMGFILSRQQEDGSLGEQARTLPACHKAPLVMMKTGHAEEAQRLLGWVVETFGDDRGIPAGPHWLTSWLVIAAHLGSRFDVSFPAVEHIARCQGKGVGGIYEYSEGRRAETHHILSTAAAGLAFLHCGKVAEARKAGLFLRSVPARQPEGNHFHARFDHRGMPVVEAGEEQEYDREDSLPNVLDRSAEGQPYAMLGLPEVFLAKLSEASGEERFLNAAKGYAHIAHRVQPDIWGGVAGSMSAWGEAVVYRLTRRRRYLRFAERLVGYLIDNQQENGAWLREADNTDLGEEAGLSIDATATAVLALTECLREVQ